MNMKFSATTFLRLISGLIAVGTVTAYGYLHRSPLCIFSLGLVFTVLYALGKWREWQKAWEQGGLKQILRAAIVTYPVQSVLVGIFYLVGYGFGSLLSPGRAVASHGRVDLLCAAGLLILGGLLGMAIHLSERHGTGALAASPDDEPDVEDEDEVNIDPTPLTPDTFFLSHYYGHKNFKTGELYGRAYADSEMIAETETRLGIRFPSLLRSLYERQNGGYVGCLYVPLSENPRPSYSDWRGVFSIDYCNLLPLEELQTFCLAEEDDVIPENAARLVMLSKRYLDITYLDYSAPGEPRVGVKDFDEYPGEQSVEFDDFESFFCALRRMKDD